MGERNNSHAQNQSQKAPLFASLPYILSPAILSISEGIGCGVVIAFEDLDKV